ncbi:MAG: cell division protein ZapB [Bacillaceae bacterium]|nr:cell division protein ZapB [Bacillaceae bacterium]
MGFNEDKIRVSIDTLFKLRMERDRFEKSLEGRREQAKRLKYEKQKLKQENEKLKERLVYLTSLLELNKIPFA